MSNALLQARCAAVVAHAAHLKIASAETKALIHEMVHGKPLSEAHSLVNDMVEGAKKMPPPVPKAKPKAVPPPLPAGHEAHHEVRKMVASYR